MKKSNCISTGFPALDNALGGGFKCGELTLIGGRPAMGKTSLAISMANHFSANCSQQLAIFSMEMSKEQLNRRYQMNICGVLDDTPNLSLIKLVDKIRQLVREQHIEIVIIDYLQLIGKEDSKDAILSTLRDLAQELFIHMIVLCQMNRNVHPNPNHIPQTEDIIDISSWESVSNVLLLHRPEYYDTTKDDEGQSSIGKAQLFICKVHSQELQDNLAIDLLFDEKSGKFTYVA